MRLGAAMDAESVVKISPGIGRGYRRKPKRDANITA